ncbi:MAG: hypothetical protein Q9225_002411 [Loekoesia sp. 1 TL-2023]
MPPFIARKRRRSSSPTSLDHTTPKEQVKKPTLFDAADQRPAGSLKANESFVNGLTGSDSDTSLSDASSADFEDVTPQHVVKKQKLDHHDEDDEEIDWEDAMHGGPASETLSTAVQPSGDLELTLDKSSRIGSFTNPHNQKKGPSKIERQIRVVTHCMHVQFLLFHNSMRSRWACDTKVQKILVDQLPPTIKQVVETWRLASGLPQDRSYKGSQEPPKQARGKRRRDRKGEDIRSQRDWGKPAERQEKGAANMSHGDPVYRLLKALAAYWKKRFTITTPCLRKQGYKPLARLEEEIASFKNDKHDPEEHGERITSLEAFKDHAGKCEGSRDIGAQLFVALLRGLGLEARLVASLQPVGFGWNKNEEASPKRKRSNKKKAVEQFDATDINSDQEMDDLSPKPNVKTGTSPKSTSKKSKNTKKERIVHGSKNIPIDLSDSSGSELTSIGEEDDDDESVIDVTPSTPRKKPNMPYDHDLVFPTYWAEVISPITNEVYPVDPLILNPAVATKPEHLATFEPRGTKADKAKQVFAYVIAYSPDGTAKDVTTRYLKKHMWPGRTKGVRLPVEKVPVYNSKGKIKHHEDYDWFKTVMSGYTRPDHMRTAVEDIEEVKDLKPVKLEKKDSSKASEGTLQFYKTSAEYVLERHLRREEAIIPGAEPVKYFSTGKDENAKEEPVFLRKDVMICRTGESWHKEGRQIKPGERPMKMVPIRAVTLTRKREVEEAQREGGEKLKQGLYAWDQTEWIIPPPIVDGVIPKNAYGNMDCFVPTMVPEGAAHIPLRSTAKICKRLGIDFAEAVTGFEFGKQRAVPVVTGVVVAKENEERVIEEWEKDEEERKVKEEGKREKIALGMWKKLVTGLRIVERVRDEYGEEGGEVREEVNPFTNRKKEEKVLLSGRDGVEAGRNGRQSEEDEDMAGGFIAEDSDAGGGFLPHGYDHNETASASADENLDIEAQHPIQTPNGIHLNDTSPSTASSLSPPPPPKQPLPRKTQTATPNSRSKKKPTRKPQTNHEPSDNDSLSAVPDVLTSESPPPPKRSSNRKSLPASTPVKRPPPKRRSARQSAKAVRSRYFEKESDDGEENGFGVE